VQAWVDDPGHELVEELLQELEALKNEYPKA
jgi:hypothetical protein